MSKVIACLLILVVVSSFSIKEKPKEASEISEDHGKDLNEAKKMEESKLRKESLEASEKVLVGQNGENLKFSNYTGSCVSSAMVSVITRVIGDAYRYYSVNTTSNANYIQIQLEGTYTQSFTVVILSENTTFGSWYLYSTGGCTVLSWSGVNPSQPQWVYVITAIPGYYPSAFVSMLSQGSGIDYNKAAAINSIITYAEGTGTCTCFNLEGVIKGLQGSDGNKWNVICKPWKSLTLFGSVRNSLDRWYLTSPNNCEYLVWTV